MVVDITNLDSMIRGFIVNTIKEYYPDIDTSENSAFDDITIKPVIKVMRPFVETVSRLELKLNLENAKYLTESELDEIGEGNYFMPRKKGAVATTMVSLTFANLNIEDPDFIIRIPSGCSFSTGSGMVFQTQGPISLTAVDMEGAYNKQKLVYEIDIPVQATGIGSIFNVFAGEIIFCDTFFSNSLVSCVNKLDVIDGKDKEDNINYAKRIKEFYLSRQLGTAPGYRNFVMELFEEITDVYVSGYKDKYMQRDTLKVFEEATSNIIERHIGGMVDLYIKGCVYDENESIVTLNNEVIILECKYEELDGGESAISIINLTDSSKSPEILSLSEIGSDEFGGLLTGKTKLVLKNDTEQSYSESIVSDIKIIYSKIVGGSTTEEEMYIKAGHTTAELSAPVKSVDMLLNPDEEPIPNLDGRIDVLKGGHIGTTDEFCSVTLKNMSDYYNGCKVTIKYTSNRTLRLLKEALSNEQNRIITTSVVGLEAKAVPVNVQLKIKPTTQFRNTDKKFIENKIKAAIVSFFNNYKLGDAIEASDVVGWLYTDTSVNEMIQYVNLPFDAFYIPEDINEEVPSDGSQIPDGGVLPIEKIEYPILNATRFKVTIL